MKRKEWLLKTSRKGYLDAIELLKDVKEVKREIRIDDKQSVIVDTLLDTAKRERIIGIPYDTDKYISQCKRQKIPFALSEHVRGALYLDLTGCNENQRQYFMHGLRSASLHETVGTDSQVKYGPTARLSPAPQKIRETRR